MQLLSGPIQLALSTKVSLRTLCCTVNFKEIELASVHCVQCRQASVMIIGSICF